MILEQLNNLPIENFDLEVFNDISNRINDSFDGKVIHALPLPQQVVYATFWMEFEVYKVSCNQFLWNASGVLIDDANRGYKILGVEEPARIAQEALDRVMKHQKTFIELQKRNTPEAFQESYDKIDLEDLNQKWYKEFTPPTDERIKYIKDNIEDFVTDDSES